MIFSFSFLNRASPVSRLAALYAATTLMVIGLSVGAQVMTQNVLNTQAKDARTINVAGRQRMLSQKIAKLIYASRVFPIDQQREVRQELENALALFQQSHEGLLSGSQALSLTHQNSQQVEKMFGDLTPAYEAVSEAARSSLTSRIVNLDAIEQISDNEAYFLKVMNEIVGQYELEATQRVVRLQLLQKIWLGLLLLTLLPMLWPIYQVMRQMNSMLMAIHRSGEQVSESSVQIATSGEQIGYMATEQAATSAQITASSKEIATVANQLKQAISRVVSEAGQTQEKAISGEKEMAVMVAAMTLIEDATERVDQQLETIHERAKDIDQVVLTMTKVSDQINLLSLNAAIEAEKAGEAGAGFSVVAREIRRLADRSAIATLEIEALVKEMQAAADSGVNQMDDFTRQIKKGIGSTALVTQQLSEVIVDVKALLSPLSQVKQGMVAQADSAEQIRDAMAQLSVGTDQTVQSLQDNNSALVQLQGAAEGLREAA